VPRFPYCRAILPRKSGRGPEAADAIKKQATSDMSAYFPNAQITVQVDDLKCTKTSDDIFEWAPARGQILRSDHREKFEPD
jgi:hypothetical protein